MYTSFMFEKILKNYNKKYNKPEFIYRWNKGKVIIYLSNLPKYRAIGNSEHEALTNLRNLFDGMDKK